MAVETGAAASPEQAVPPRAGWRTLWDRPGVRTAVGVVLGAIVGGLYGHYVGCLTGSCPLTSNPWSAGALGAVVGGSLLSPGRRAAA